ncbi:MAG: hypothetical protein ISR09_00375 [Candidatus Thalassarchaeum sp.]|nr:hypothetical protein [Candidatus Thalassarchaeum sp.]
MLRSRLTSSISALALVFLMLTMSQIGLIECEKIDTQNNELEMEAAPLFASSPGHSVFGEYVGAHWCGPCMSSASPSLNNLKTSNPDDFTYVSFFQGSGTGWPDDAIGSSGTRRDHVMAASSGYPTFSFADEQTGSCYKVGAGGTNFYDNDYTSGGCMAPSSSDFTMELSTSLDSAGEIVTTDLTITYLGSIPSVSVYVYAAVTEHSGAENYDDGYKPHHVFRSWLLNTNNNGFEQVILSPNNPSELSWDESLSVVRAADGKTQYENFWPVVALMDGPHTSYNNFYAAIDLDMAPLVDIGISDFIIEGNPGFIQGDNLVLSSTLQNNGVDAYLDGGNIDIYFLDGLEEVYLAGASINSNLATGATQDFSVNFDTSSIAMQPSGTSVFRARLSNLDGDRIASNNYADVSGLHDLPPVPSTPTAVSSPNVNRGSTVQFEVSAIANDLVDTMNTMYPTLQYSESGSESWDDTWIEGPEIIGNGGNSRYQYSINTELTSEVGNYDLRVMWTDAGGQNSGWLESSDAFLLQNSVPVIYSSSSNEYAGMPTVKVDSDEAISIIGLINDAETPLQLLEITSDDTEFISWDPISLEITVRFSQVIRDSHGNPLPLGIYFNVNDGDDTNSGLILFNVIENGAPRWSPINTQSFDEGGYGSITFTNYLSDTDDSGNSVPVAGLSLSILDISDGTFVEANLNGHSLSLVSLDDDQFGIVDITVRASDGIKYSDTTVTFHILNVNDAPRIDLTGIEDVTLQTGDVSNILLSERITDVDDSDDEIWIVVSNEVTGSTQWNPITGILSMSWQEPGVQTVSVTAEDRYGDVTSSIIQVNVVDELPLVWKNGALGDLTISLDTTDYYTNPSVEISNVGELVLSEITVFWSICNTVTGICHTSGISHNFGPFIVNHIGGEGLGIGDYMTFTVRAVDEDGMDRVTEETLKFHSTLPSLIIDDNQSEDINEANSGMGILMISGIMSLVLLLLITLLLSINVVLRRKKQSQDVYDTYDQPSVKPLSYHVNNTPKKSSGIAPPPPPPLMAQLPPGGLPDGWSMEQWHYYGEEYLRRVK